VWGTGRPVPHISMLVAVGFDEGYTRWRASSAHAALMGKGLPDSVQPFSFVPFEGMQYVLAELALSAGETLVDLGCGRGGPGLWLAAQARAGLIGVDGSRVAVEDARQRASLFEGVTSARFEVADVTRTGLPDGCADAVVSIDVFQLVADKTAMIGEIVRLLKPGGRVVLTTWEAFGEVDERFPRAVSALLDGFSAVSVVEQPAWLTRQFEIYERAIAADDGTDPAVTDIANEARQSLPEREYFRRVVVTARH
jgi:SAM-dependent methyltransferase